MSTWPPVNHQDVQDAVAALRSAPPAHASTHAAAGSDPVSLSASQVTGVVASTTVTTIVTLTAAAYAALGTPDAATLYVVTP